jgi:hypothetical protein
MDTEIKNARIEYTQLGPYRFCIGLTYGGTGQNFVGPISLLPEVLKVLEAEHWEDLVGMHVRAESSWTDIPRLGHILKDKWAVK